MWHTALVSVSLYALRSSVRTGDAVQGTPFSVIVGTSSFYANAAMAVAAWHVTFGSASLYVLCFSTRIGVAVHGTSFSVIVGASSFYLNTAMAVSAWRVCATKCINCRLILFHLQRDNPHSHCHQSVCSCVSARSPTSR